MSRGERRPRLRAQLVAATMFVALVPLLVLTLSFLLFQSRAEETSARSRVDEAARSIASSVDSFLRNHLAALASLSTDWAQADALDRPDLSDWLVRWHRHHPHLLTMVAADRSGLNIAASPPVNLDGTPRARSGQSIADREYFQRALHDEKPFISGVFRGRGAGTDVIVALSVPLRGRTGEVAGVLEGSLNLSRLSEVAGLFDGIEEGQILILDRDGRVIFASEGTGLAPLDLVPPGKGGPSFIEARSSADAGWTVVVRQPLGVLRRRQVRFAGLGGLVVVVALGLSLLVARQASGRTTRPLERLTSELDRIESRDTPAAELLVDRSAPVEVVRFAEHVNTTTRRLRDADAELRAVLASLERTVADRTAALSASEEKFAKVFQLNPSPIALRSLATGLLVDVNDAFVKIVGYEREEVIGEASARIELVIGDHRFASALPEVAARGAFRDLERDVRTKDGRVLHGIFAGEKLEIGGEPMLLTVMNDITARRQAEEALRLSEAKYRILTECATDLVSRHDRDSVFLYASASSLQLLGYAPEELVGRPALDLVHPDDLPLLAAALANAGAAFEPRRVSYRARMKDGTWLWVETIGRMVLDPVTGERTEIHAATRDISDRKRAEEKLQRLTEELEKRVEERTRDLQASSRELAGFTHSVAHDLRAPLRAIDGFSRIFAATYEPLVDDEGRRLLAVIETNARRMGRLIDGLLSFARLGRAELRCSSIDMKALAEGILAEILSDTARRRVEARVEARVQALPPAEADRDLVRVALENLLSNAVKFSAERNPAVIEVGFQDGAGGVEYFVRDNGVGFDARYADKLFGVFQRLHDVDTFEGAGVGLALVKRVVERHGGRVRAEGEIGRGATFWFTLPGVG